MMISEGFFDHEHIPAMEEVVEYVGGGDSYWSRLTAFIEESYGVSPKMTFSKCSAKPGWNVKYKKGGKSLCTLYPENKFFTALVVVGDKESDQIRIRFGAFSSDFRKIFENAGSMNGCRWLMLEVKDEPVLDDIKEVLQIKVKPASKKTTWN